MLPDLRKFKVSSSQIKSLMKEFGLGGVLNYSVEKGITHHHSNRIVVVKSDKDNEYVFKFYLKKERPLRFYIQFLVANKLIKRNFGTCRMYLTNEGKPFFKLKDYFVAAYDKIDGFPISYVGLDQLNKKKLVEFFTKLRRELMMIEGKISFMRYIGSDLYRKYDLSNLMKSIYPKSIKDMELNSMLRKISICLSPEKNKNRIRFVHGGVTSHNILCRNGDYYLIDFDHLGYDYCLQEFGGFIANLYMEKKNKDLINNLISEYVNANKLDTTSLRLLFSIVSFELIREYLKLSDRLNNLIKNKKLPDYLSIESAKFDKEELTFRERHYLAYLRDTINFLCNKLSN